MARMEGLLRWQRTLLFNWLVGPVFGYLVYANKGAWMAAAFFAAWIALDRIWDAMTTIWIRQAGETATEEDLVMGIVPSAMTKMMVLDLIGTLTVPWMVGITLLAC